MTAAELMRRTQETTALVQLWVCLMGKPSPETEQFYHWLLRFGFDGTRDAIERTAHKAKLLHGGMGLDYRRKYCTSVAKNARAQSEATKRKHTYPFVQTCTMTTTGTKPARGRTRVAKPRRAQTRAQCAEIEIVRERLKAVAKATTPCTRRAAALLRDDLATWQRWAVNGVDLPRLPRRIRVGLAKPAKRKKDLKNKNEKNVQTRNVAATKKVSGALPEREMLEMLATDYPVCIAIATAITQSAQAAEDVVSACVASAVEQVRTGKVQADNAAKFHAWLHTIIRRNAMRRAGQSQSRFVEYQRNATNVTKLTFAARFLSTNVCGA